MGYVVKIGEPAAKPAGAPAPRKQEPRKAGGGMAAEFEVTPPMLWTGGVVAAVALAAGLWFAFGRGGASGTMPGDFRPSIPGPGAQGMPAGGPPVPVPPGGYGGAVRTPQPGPPGGFPNPGPPGARF